MTGPGADDPDRADDDDPRDGASDDPQDDAADDSRKGAGDDPRAQDAEDTAGRDVATPPPGYADEADAGSDGTVDATGESAPSHAERADAANTAGSETPPAAADEDDGDVSPGEVGYARWLLTTSEPGVVFIRDVVSSVGTVVLVGMVLFAVSGLWPPLVAVESGSMEPHMYKGDLVFVMDEQRFPPDQAAADTGVVTYQGAKQVDAREESKRGYRSFGEYGNVVVYERDGTDGKPIIHRAMLYVEADENWVERANQSYLGGATTCEQLYSCPAPYDGFITKGDANAYYDQSRQMQLSGVVKPEWIRGRAKARVPWLGHVRLLFGAAGATPSEGDAVATTDAGPVGQPAPASSVGLATAASDSTGSEGVSHAGGAPESGPRSVLPSAGNGLALAASGLVFASRRLHRRTAS